MKPPPATPTPRRFLNKRPASSQLSHATPTPMRFQSTPRFGSTQTATRRVEDVEEIGDGPSQSQSSAAELPRSDGRDLVSDSIEVDSYADSLASPEELRSSSGSSEYEMEEDGDAGRRRGYVSGLHEDEEEEDDTAVDAPVERMYEDADTPPVKRRRLSASASPTRLHMVAAYDSDTGYYEDRGGSDQDDEEHDVQDRTRTRPPAQQPSFQTAPRFKPAPEDEFPAHDQSGSALLAAPLSPRRRGAQYLAGGLAAQLQGLLSQVKGSETLGGGDGAIVRLLVEEARPGARMHLVRGRVLTRGPAASEGESAAPQSYILAGGSGVRMVKEGSVLRIMPAPAWDVHLGEEEWTVTCDWSVESLES